MSNKRSENLHNVFRRDSSNIGECLKNFRRQSIQKKNLSLQKSDNRITGFTSCTSTKNIRAENFEKIAENKPPTEVHTKNGSIVLIVLLNTFIFLFTKIVF